MGRSPSHGNGGDRAGEWKRREGELHLCALEWDALPDMAREGTGLVSGRGGAQYLRVHERDAHPVIAPQ